ncbi:mannan endo-1,4-beta-mannosidase-like [Branchiostoma floridae x Branchiostoma japonicum]
MGMFRVAVLLFVLSSVALGQHYLSTEGQHFKLNGQRVFLSGLNMAWCRHGYDFGGVSYNFVSPGEFCPHPREAYEQAIRDIRNNGGNSLRVWLHVDGRHTPVFSSWGSVTQTDSTNQLINDLKSLLSYAKARNVLVFLVLWNGAHHHDMYWKRLQNLIWDDLKLDTYLEHALKPLAGALKNQRALGGWEIMNEPEGSLKIEHHSDPCYDTIFLQGTGAGWAHLDTSGLPTWTDVPRHRVLRFINRQAAAIKAKDPNHLVTVGSWSEHGQGVRNLYSDSCLQQAGGLTSGVLDFYQIHTYSHNGNYGSQAPFVVTDASDYPALSGKPIVIGEFSQARGAGMTITEQFNRAYSRGFAGAWSWHYLADRADDTATDASATQLIGLRELRFKNDQAGGGCVRINLNSFTNYCEKKPPCRQLYQYFYG